MTEVAVAYDEGEGASLTGELVVFAFGTPIV